MAVAGCGRLLQIGGAYLDTSVALLQVLDNRPHKKKLYSPLGDSQPLMTFTLPLPRYVLILQVRTCIDNERKQGKR